MIFKSKLPSLPKEGDIRISKRFAWWPTRLYTDSEYVITVWLRSFWIEEEYIAPSIFNLSGGWYISKLSLTELKQRPKLNIIK